MASYGAEYPPPPPQGTRSRGASNASNRYVPDNYPPQPQQAPPQLSPGYPYPYGLPTERASPMTPMYSTGAVPTMAGQQVPPENTLHPASAAARLPYPTTATDPYIQSRPVHERERRASHSSQHSARSHHSNRSGRSHHSHHSRRSYSEEREREARHRRKERERRHSDYDEVKPVKRHDTHRPTLGDTIFSLFGELKSYLGPRDKY